MVVRRGGTIRRRSSTHQSIPAFLSTQTIPLFATPFFHASRYASSDSVATPTCSCTYVIGPLWSFFNGYPVTLFLVSYIFGTARFWSFFRGSSVTFLFMSYIFGDAHLLAIIRVHFFLTAGPG